MTTADQVRLDKKRKKGKKTCENIMWHTWKIILQLAIVDQTLLGEGEKATVFANGGLVKDWKKSQRLVVIVAKNETK